MSETSCCPSDSVPYLAAEYAAKGTVKDLGAVEIYVAPVLGKPTAGILMMPDVWGWNGGRVRAIADSLAEQGYIVAVGKLLTPAFDGGTDGDALSPTSSFNMQWIKQFPYPTVQKPKVDAILAYLKEAGAAKIGVMGFCYGGHPACWAASEDPAIACGVVLHPSIMLETFAFGGKTEDLMQGVKCPFLLCPAGNDLDKFGEDRPYSAALKASAKGSECAWRPYPEMSHGWSCRGELSDPKVARDVDLVMKDSIAYFGKYLA